MQAIERLPEPSRPTIVKLVDSLQAVPGIVAIALGGSHARGRARPESDIDLGVLYDEVRPIDLDALRAVCRGAHQSDSEPVVTEPYAWGPWINGGAWLDTSAGRVDLLYRSFDKVARVFEAASAGRFELHYNQQAPFGFFGPTVLGEISVCQPLFARDGRLALWKARVVDYPDALRSEVTRALLWQVEFNLTGFLPKFARREDPYGTAGCLARAAHHLVLVLFALHRIYPLNEKTVLDEIDEWPDAPHDFRGRVRAILAAPGATREALEQSGERMRELFLECVAASGGLYEPRGSPDPA